MTYHRIQCLEPAWTQSVRGIDKNGNGIILNPVTIEDNISGMHQESEYTCLGCDAEFAGYQEAINHLKQEYDEGEHLSFKYLNDGTVTSIVSSIQTELNTLSTDSKDQSETTCQYETETMLNDVDVAFRVQAEEATDDEVSMKIKVIVSIGTGSKYDTFNPPSEFSAYSCEHPRKLIKEIERMLALIGDIDGQPIYHQDGRRILHYISTYEMNYEPTQFETSGTEHLRILQE